MRVVGRAGLQGVRARGTWGWRERVPSSPGSGLLPSSAALVRVVEGGRRAEVRPRLLTSCGRVPGLLAAAEEVDASLPGSPPGLRATRRDRREGTAKPRTSIRASDAGPHNPALRSSFIPESRVCSPSLWPPNTNTPTMQQALIPTRDERRKLHLSFTRRTRGPRRGLQDRLHEEGQRLGLLAALARPAALLEGLFPAALERHPNSARRVLWRRGSGEPRDRKLVAGHRSLPPRRASYALVAGDRGPAGKAAARPYRRPRPRDAVLVWPARARARVSTRSSGR
jgi:hypothetical protein